MAAASEPLICVSIDSYFSVSSEKEEGLAENEGNADPNLVIEMRSKSLPLAGIKAEMARVSKIRRVSQERVLMLTEVEE